jgi:N-acetylglucosaminyldiphosphoundecaprenol N-acetyl-beta-D-mannosaminyltransferase
MVSKRIEKHRLSRAGRSIFCFSIYSTSGRNIKKNQGPDVFKHFIERLNETSGKAFFLGSSETVLQNIRERIHKEYPNITVGTHSPLFKKEFSRRTIRKWSQLLMRLNPISFL